MSIEQIMTIAIILTVGSLFGSLIVWLSYRIKFGKLNNLADEILQKAENDAELKAKSHDLKLKEKEVELQRKADAYLNKEKSKLQIMEERIKNREDKLERRMSLVEKKLSDIEKREAILQARRSQLDEEKKQYFEKEKMLLLELESLSGYSSQEAKEILLGRIADEVQTDKANYIRKMQKEAEEESDKAACRLISTAINRLSLPQVSESTVTTAAIPHDEMKGRIIGREGRNIRTLEKATGVNFLIDDTPGVVVISGFDPIRKEVAKLALQDLMNDGRIHPTRIEEAVEKAQSAVQKEIRKYGEDAAYRIGAVNLNTELIQLLGKLKYRFSYGQNVLDHSLEVAYIMGMIAAELGLDEDRAKRIGLLHDIGKAVSHEIEGTHALIGRDLALKYGEPEGVANGIGCHHNEIPSSTPEGALIEAVDRLSSARPGARIEAVEEYVKRLKKLEEIALGFPGIEKAYAMQAGREVRVVVLPDMIDDQGLLILARDISKMIEKQLTYPGKIKVTVIREKRTVEYAV